MAGFGNDLIMAYLLVRLVFHVYGFDDLLFVDLSILLIGC